MKPFYVLQRCRVTAISSFSTILITALLLILYRSGSKPSPQFNLRNQPRISHQTAVQLQLAPSLGFMNGTDFIWQVPKSPKAVLLIAHGCNGKASNFWEASSSCPNCVGLPEERLLVLHALDRNFAVIVISSLRRCWSFGKEKENVKWILHWWIAEHKLHNLPVVALGASSGGHFVSALAAEVRFSSITLMIAEGVFDYMGIPKNYPPTLFVHMPKDRRRMKLMQKNIENLRMEGVHVKEVRCMEFALTARFLRDRMPWLDQSFVVQLFELLQERGFVDEKGYMRRDGRETPWKEAFREKPFLYEKNRWIDHIQEELNLAYGYHEMTSLQSDDIFSWFESHLRPHLQ